MNKKNILIIVLVGIICLCLGIGIGYFIGKNNQTTEDLKVNKEENNKDENKDLVLYDEYFLSANVQTTPEEIITSSDDSWSGEYLGAMYTTNISDEYKVVVSLYQYLSTEYGASTESETLSEYLFDNLTGDDESLSIEIKLETLNKIVSTFFADTSIDNGFNTDEGYREVQSISCNNNMCKITMWGIGGTGFPPHYNSKITKKITDSTTGNTEITVSSYYTEIGNNAVNVYSKKNGELIKAIPYTEEEFEKMTDDFYLYDSYSSYLESNLKSYKYTFNKDNQLISVEEI